MDPLARIAVAFGCVVLLLPAAVAAQSTTGTVLDISGGVIPAASVTATTKDGKSVTVFTGSKVPRQKMWLGLQGLNKKCSSVYGNCPFSSYPSTAKIEIDWVAHWRRA